MSAIDFTVFTYARGKFTPHLQITFSTITVWGGDTTPFLAIFEFSFQEDRRIFNLCIVCNHTGTEGLCNVESSSAGSEWSALSLETLIEPTVGWFGDKRVYP